MIRTHLNPPLEREDFYAVLRAIRTHLNPPLEREDFYAVLG